MTVPAAHPVEEEPKLCLAEHEGRRCILIVHPLSVQHEAVDRDTGLSYKWGVQVCNKCGGLGYYDHAEKNVCKRCAGAGDRPRSQRAVIQGFYTSFYHEIETDAYMDAQDARIAALLAENQGLREELKAKGETK